MFVRDGEGRGSIWRVPLGGDGRARTSYRRKLTESVMGPLLAAAADPVKLHMDQSIMKNPQVRVRYQEKLYSVMTCRNVGQKFAGEKFSVSHYTGFRRDRTFPNNAG